MFVAGEAGMQIAENITELVGSTLRQLSRLIAGGCRTLPPLRFRTDDLRRSRFAMNSYTGNVVGKMTQGLASSRNAWPIIGR